MELINRMIKYYINTARRSFKLTARNWPVMFALVVYSFIINFFSAFITMGTFFIGGIILAIVTAACTGSYLYLIQNVINNRIVDIRDFKNSFTAYLVRVMNTAFYIWIASIIYQLVSSSIHNLPYGWIITLAVYLAAIIVLNPLPELIYMSYHREIALFRSSYEFVKENLWEWMIPNIVLLSILYYLLGGSFNLFIRLSAVGIIKYILGLFALFFTMVYRGILFRFLNESTRRSRLFKLRMLN